MAEFEVFSGDLKVGCSALDLGDPAMGVVSGAFHPAADYASIRSCVVEAAGCARQELQLSVRTVSGESLDAQSVVICDYSAELGAGGLEVAVLGVDHLQYARLFPHHVAAYDRQFG